MQTRVSLWGGSCAVRLPKMAVESLGLYEGEPVTLSLEGDALVIRHSRKRYLLSALVSEAADLDAPDSTDDGGIGSEEL